AIGVSIIAVLVVAWELGVIAALVEIAGGAANVVVSIGISELIYICTAQHYTLQGFLMAALDGYLMALGFRGGALVGRAVAGRIGTESIRRVMVGWIAERLITGTVGGAGSAALVTFSHDLINIFLGRGGFSSPGDYVRHMALGGALGIVFEFGA